MGIDGLTQYLEEGKELTGRLSSLPRSVKATGEEATCILAWDLSGSLYPPIRTRGADDFHAYPRRPVSAVLRYLDNIISYFVEENVGLIAVTDGVDHPWKLETATRKYNQTKAEAALLKLRQKNSGRGFLHDYGEYQALKKQHTKVRPDILCDVRDHLLGCIFTSSIVCFIISARTSHFEIFA